MSEQNPTRNYKRRKANPTGRVDILALSLLDASIAKWFPEITPVYNQARPAIQAEVMKYLGPRRKHMRNITDVVRNLSQMRQQARTGVTGHQFVREVKP